MKKYKYLSLILALILILTTLPLTALAAPTTMDNYQSATHTTYDNGSSTIKYVFDNTTSGKGSVYVRNDKVVKVIGDTQLNTVFKVGDAVVHGGGPIYYRRHHTHFFSFRVARTGHGLACKCGAWKVQFAHIDPLEAKDGKCVCGYTFYDNAQLNVLWMRNVQLSPRFHRDTLEYTGKLTKDVDEITLVTTRLFDEMATLEAPVSYKLKPGTNVFKFTVTAQDKKTTQTYTVTIEK